ncbi:MAG: universal stress protein [Chloroflexia bacterium]
MSGILHTGLLHAASDATSHVVAPATVLVPMLNLGVADDMLQLAAILAAGSGTPDESLDAVRPHVVVLGIVEVPARESLTTGLDMARSYRALLDFLPTEVRVGKQNVRVDHVVKVAHDVPSAVEQAVRDEKASLVLFYWKGHSREPKRHLYGTIIDAVLKKPPCDVVLARPEAWRDSKRILLPVRGGPSAERALNIATLLAEYAQRPLTVMHNIAPPDNGEGDAASTVGEEPYAIFTHHLQEVTASASISISSVLTRELDAAAALLKEARRDDLVIMGMASSPLRGHELDTGTYPVSMRMSGEKGPPLLVLRTAEPIDIERYTRTARSRHDRRSSGDMPFEHWFVENTYHGDEFKDANEFLKLKQASSLSLSVALLTFNDAERIYSLITGMKKVLTEIHPIADQIAVIDGGSSDGTVEMARSLGVEVYEAEGLLADRGALYGRGESWWKSLAVLRGDLLVWLDPRARKFHPSSAMSLAGPLLRVPSLQLVKAFGHEHAEGAGRKDGGSAHEDTPSEINWGGSAMPRREAGMVSGRVRVQALSPRDLLGLDSAALAALPPHTILQALFPSLAGVMSPFGRDMAGRREAMLLMPVMTGVNFEVGLLLSVAAQYGTRSIAQVELRHGLPTPAPRPSLRSALDVLQVLSTRLDDNPRMRRFAVELVERLQHESEGKGRPTASDRSAQAVEIRALAPVERPPMREVMG